MESKNRLIAVLSVFCIMLFCSFVFTFHMWYSCDYSGVSHDKHNFPICYADGMSYIIIDDVKYVPMTTKSFYYKTLTPDRFIGYLTDFQSSAQRCPCRSGGGGIYTVLESEKILAVFHTVGGTEYYKPAE